MGIRIKDLSSKVDFVKECTNISYSQIAKQLEVDKAQFKRIMDNGVIPSKRFEKFKIFFSKFDIVLNDDSISSYLYNSSSKQTEFINKINSQETHQTDKYQISGNVSDIINEIKNNRIPVSNEYIDINCHGVFFPALLLYPGWWNRENKHLTVNLDGCNELQKWLFTGFEQWAPSWELSLETSKKWLISMLASHDEADSLSLIIDKNQANEVRKLFYKTNTPFNVEVHGRLIRREDLPESVALSNHGISSSLSDYCIIVSDEKQSDAIKILDDNPFFSGYLWQCCIPEKKYTALKGMPGFVDPKVSDVYMVWTHTNYGSKEAVAYNLHSLNSNKLFIEKSIGDKLLVLQNSSIVLGEEKTILSKDKFYNSICNYLF